MCFRMLDSDIRQRGRFFRMLLGVAMRKILGMFHTYVISSRTVPYHTKDEFAEVMEQVFGLYKDLRAVCVQPD